MADIGLTVPFTPSAGTAESRWLRLVQVGAAGNIATMDEAADLIDSLYSVSPCETGTEGTGGEAADDSNLPDEDTFFALSADKLGELCEDQDHWDVQVDLLRSHQTPSAWQARSATATLIRTELVTESKTETVTLDGVCHHDLEYPYHSGLTVCGADVVDVRGSTINFARPTTGRVRITYTTRYERLTVRVPATPDEHGQAQAEPAAIIVFWDGRAAQCDLRQPETDTTVSAAELARLCRGPDIHVTVGGSCWQTIEHYKRCSCSDTEAPGGWSEQVAASCPKGVGGGSHLGTVRRMDGYIGCPGERDGELSDPEYYKKICCHYPPAGKGLPECRKTYALWRGGEPIEGGADHWRDIYGPDVRLVSVTPPDGVCGQVIREWDVNQRSCCDDIIPLSPHPENPTAFHPGEHHLVGVLDGKPGELRWQAYGGLYFVVDGQKVRTARVPIRRWAVYAESDVCPQPYVEVDDGCVPLRMTFEGGGASEPVLSEHDMAVMPDRRFSLIVHGGVPPYMWMAEEGVSILSISADGGQALFKTESRDAWCVARITVSDQCGQSDECSVRNAETGRWIAVPLDDRCSPDLPGAGGRMLNPVGIGYSELEPKDGYRMAIRAFERNSPFFGCPAGTVLSSDGEPYKREVCGNRHSWSGWTWDYAAGVCTWRRPSGEVGEKTYYMDVAQGVWKWICT